MKHAGLLLLHSAALFAQPAPESIKLDNEFVRVMFLTDRPGAKTPLHQHEFDRVMIYLDPIRLVLRYQDGEVDRQTWRNGQVAWSPGRRLHTGENLMDRSAPVVEVELKKPPSGKPFRISARDPITTNPKNVTVEFENETARVLRCKYAANVREPLHEHLSGERLTVALDDVELSVTTQGSADRITKLAAGQPFWSTGPVVHAAQANRAVELIVIEPLIWVASPAFSFAEYALGTGLLVAGVMCLVIGLWLFCRSHADLGANWSITLEIREQHRLITQDVYRRIRHPMYLALALYSICLALVVPNWVAGPSNLIASARRRG